MGILLIIYINIKKYNAIFFSMTSIIKKYILQMFFTAMKITHCDYTINFDDSYSENLHFSYLFSYSFLF